MIHQEFFMFSEKKMTICLRKFSFIKNKDIEWATTTMLFVLSCIFVQQRYLHLYIWSN